MAEEEADAEAEEVQGEGEEDAAMDEGDEAPEEKDAADADDAGDAGDADDAGDAGDAGDADDAGDAGDAGDAADAADAAEGEEDLNEGPPAEAEDEAMEEAMEKEDAPEAAAPQAEAEAPNGANGEADEVEQEADEAMPSQEEKDGSQPMDEDADHVDKDPYCEQPEVGHDGHDDGGDDRDEGNQGDQGDQGDGDQGGQPGASVSPSRGSRGTQGEELESPGPRRRRRSRFDEKPEDEPTPMEDEAFKEREEDKPYVECEEDAAEDEREKVEAGTFQASRTYSSLNVLPSTDSRLLIPLNDEGLGHLFAGVRATAGLKGGRYLFEVKVLEVRRAAEYGRRHKNIPKHLVAIGFSTSDSSLFLGDGEDGVGFDTEGCLILNGQKNWMEGFNDRIPVERQLVLSVLLNLIPDSPNCHTFSLFVNGKRVGRPQQLPEALRERPLYPTVNFKNVTLHANFTAPAMAPLPFKCRTLHDAAQEDVEVLPEPEGNQPDGRHEVIFLIGLPTNGTHAFLEEFQKEKQASARFTELSAASMKHWAKLSGFWSRGDELGIEELDRGNVTQNVVQSIAPFVEQNFIIKELPKNFLSDFRQSSLTVFDAGRFKRTAVVMLGSAPESTRAAARTKLLKQRQEKVAAEVKRAKRPSKWDNGDANPALSPEELEAEIQKAVDAVEVPEEDEKAWLEEVIDEQHENELARSFEKFTIPSEEEGFQEICFVWDGEEESNEDLKQWMAEKKLVQRVGDLRPTGWFKEKLREWQTVLSKWKQRQEDWQDPVKRRRIEKPKLLPVGMLSDHPENGVDVATLAGGEGEVQPLEEVDPWKLLDLMDIGSGEPLFSKFSWEDWMMLELRVQLHLLVHGYKHAMNDPQRVTFHESHTEYYYEVFYRRALRVRHFGVTSLEDLLDMVKDTMEVIPSKSLLDPQLSDDTPFENFVRLTEDARRLRFSKLDAGDASAQLRLTRSEKTTPSAPKFRKEFRGDEDARHDRHGDRYGDRERYGDRDRGKGNRYGKGDRGYGKDRGKGDRERDERGKANPRGYDREPRRDAGPRGGRDREWPRDDRRPPPPAPPAAPPRYGATKRPYERTERDMARTSGPRDRDGRGDVRRDRDRGDRRNEAPRSYGGESYSRRPAPPPPQRAPPKTRYDSGYAGGGYKGGQRGPPR